MLGPGAFRIFRGSKSASRSFPFLIENEKVGGRPSLIAHCRRGGFIGRRHGNFHSLRGEGR